MASYTVVQIRDRDDADRLVEISLDPKLYLTLDSWQNKYTESLVTIENKRSRKNSAKNEVYQLLGFYAVFQGVVLTAVTTASTLQCYNSWGALALSALVSFAALLSIHAKLKDYMKLRRKLSSAVTDSQVSVSYHNHIHIHKLEFLATIASTNRCWIFQIQFVFSFSFFGTNETEFSLQRKIEIRSLPTTSGLAGETMTVHQINSPPRHEPRDSGCFGLRL